jgi:hypothetical protein
MNPGLRGLVLSSCIGLCACAAPVAAPTGAQGAATSAAVATAPVATGPAPAAAPQTGAALPAPTPECAARTSELFDYALRYKEAITLGQLERSQAAWAVRHACGDLPGLLSNAVNAARVPKPSAPRTEYDDSWVLPLVFLGAIVHSATR